jgi:hypothetical protein
MKRFYTLALIFLTVALSCGPEQERQEQITRLRGIGAVSAPLVQTPSTDSQSNTVTLTTYVAIPLDQTITATAFVDEPVFGAYMVSAAEMQISTSMNYTDYDDFRLASFDTVVAIPKLSVFQALNPLFSGIQMRYGFEISTGDDTEQLTGSFLVYPEGSSELSWQNTTVNLAAPVSTDTISAGSEVSFEASATDQNDDNIKYGWFVSGGKVKNRRSSKTTWSTPGEAGSYTVIITARGKKSRSFSFDIVQVTLN